VGTQESLSCRNDPRSRGVLEAPVKLASTAALAACAVLVAGCGGGSRQDAAEPSATFQVAIAGSFPRLQAVARPAVFTLLVHNTGASTVPNVAVTVNSFNYASNFPELAANKRPIWAIERGPGAAPKQPVESQEVSPPGGGQTAYVNTWALGPLAPGHTQVFRWHVVPVKAGTFTVNYSVAAGLSGKAKAEAARGGLPAGRITVHIAKRPPPTYVDPATGKVVPGVAPAQP